MRIIDFRIRKVTRGLKTTHTQKITCGWNSTFFGGQTCVCVLKVLKVNK